MGTSWVAIVLGMWEKAWVVMGDGVLVCGGGANVWCVCFGVLSEGECICLRSGLERILNGRLTLLARWQVSGVLRRVIDTWPYLGRPSWRVGYFWASGYLFAAVYHLLNDWKGEWDG